MIQIQRRAQFTNAGERLRSERQSIRRHEPGLYEITNTAKGNTYHVRIEARDGLTFGSCTCEAGLPTKGQRIPVVCKHLCAVVIFLRAVREMRLRALY